MAIAGAGAVDAANAGEETTVVTVITAGAVAQATEKPQAHVENLAISVAATSISGGNAQNCCASAARRRDTASSLIWAQRTW